MMESGNSTDADKPPKLPEVVKTTVVSHDPDQKDCNKGPSKNVEAPEAKDRLVGNVSSASLLPKGNGASDSETVLTVQSSSFVLPKINSAITVAPAANASLVILFLHVIDAYIFFCFLHIIFVLTWENIFFSVHVSFFILRIILFEGCGGTPIIFWPVQIGHQEWSGNFAWEPSGD